MSDDGFVWMGGRQSSNERPRRRRTVDATEIRAQITALQARLQVITGDIDAWTMPADALPAEVLEPTLRDVAELARRWVMGSRVLGRVRVWLPSSAVHAVALFARR
jgi:hypothetical protein